MADILLLIGMYVFAWPLNVFQQICIWVLLIAPVANIIQYNLDRKRQE